jgi:hypothetical protein
VVQTVAGLLCFSWGDVSELVVPAAGSGAKDLEIVDPTLVGRVAALRADGLSPDLVQAVGGRGEQFCAVGSDLSTLHLGGVAVG